ncbi:MAG TPA: Uma2 family endonuclease [Kofleriaceae bacterium]|jgi:Uma2 family endonuclease
MSVPGRPPTRRATIEDFLAIPEDERFHELIGGEIIRKASPSGEHGASQFEIAGILGSPFGRSPPSGGPGGWWFATEVEVRFGEDICRPDILGWRRAIVPTRPRGKIVEVLPQWTCEILSETNRVNDLVRKKRIYHQHRVEHYWLLDPENGTFAVNRWHPDGYLEVLSAERSQTVRAEPFDAIEILVGALFGDEPESPP